MTADSHDRILQALHLLRLICKIQAKSFTASNKQAWAESFRRLPWLAQCIYCIRRLWSLLPPPLAWITPTSLLQSFCNYEPAGDRGQISCFKAYASFQKWTTTFWNVRQPAGPNQSKNPKSRNSSFRQAVKLVRQMQIWFARCSQRKVAAFGNFAQYSIVYLILQYTICRPWNPSGHFTAFANRLVKGDRRQSQRGRDEAYRHGGRTRWTLASFCKSNFTLVHPEIRDLFLGHGSSLDCVLLSECCHCKGKLWISKSI